MHNTTPDILKEMLQKYWKHDSFRPLQENIINDIINKNDTFAILPTGGGKSICYQLPALIGKGVCIVISPLIALINDQIASLKNKNIEAVTIPSKSNTEDIIRIFDNIKIKNIKLLYLSPERLTQPIIQDKLRELEVSFFAIDEAHCVSQWGHDFRPSYLKTSLLKDTFPKTPFLVVTATATVKTQEEIIKILQLKNVKKHIGSFNRPNLAYQVFETSDKFDLLLKILNKQTVSSIIYLQNRAKVVELSNRLKSNGLKSTYYHAGITNKEKDKNFKAWNTEEKNIMVATNAFGMGIDKSNVKLVIHLEIPSSIENYIQEAGRAGRNEKKAFSCVILSKNDHLKFKQLSTNNDLSFEDISTVYNKLNQHFQISYGELIENVFDFDIDVFCTKYKVHISKTTKAIQRLHNYNIINYKELQKSSSHMQIICSGKQLIHFCRNNSDYQSLTESILRNYTGIFETQKKLNIPSLSNITGFTDIEIHKKLTHLHNNKLIEYACKQNNHSIQFIVPREDNRTINHLKKDLIDFNKINTKKNIKTFHYFTNETICRNQLILNYFDQKINKTCGICDICLENEKSITFEKVISQSIELLKTKPHTFNELMIGLKTNSIGLKKVLNYLINENHLQQKQQYYQLI